VLVLGEIHTSVIGDEEMLSGEEPITSRSLGMSKDSVRKLLGDENGRVSVNLNAGSKEFGNGFSASVTVNLTCDQSEEGIEDATDMAIGLAEEGLAKAFEAGKELYKELS